MLPSTYPQALVRLDKLSPQSPDQLRGILGGREFDEHISGLDANDLVEVIEHLDKVLDGLDPTSAAFGQTLQKLRKICVSRMRIPSSYVLPVNLLNIDKNNLASGGFSDVFQGTYNGHEVCVKRLRVSSTGGFERALYREALIWKRLIHANIVPFIGVTFDPLQIVSEWMSGGNLTAHVKLNPHTNRITLLVDVAKGLNYLHQCNVVHGDLKGPNIMIDVHSCARITDFGLARNQGTAEETHVTAGGTARWTAPEILKEQGTSSKGADVFSFAMVMVEIFTGSAPFDLHPSITAALAIMRGERPPRPAHPAFTDEFWELMQHCWSQESDSRPDMSEVLEVLQNPSRLRRNANGKDSPASSRVIVSTEIQVLQNFPPIALEDLTRLRDESQFIAFIVSTTLRAEQSSNGLPPLNLTETKNLVEILDKVASSAMVNPGLKDRCLGVLSNVSSGHGVLPKSYFPPGVTLSNSIPYASGGFTDVWKGQQDGNQVCIKAFRVQTAANPDKVKRRFYREVVRWRHISHPNVLPFLGVLETFFPFCIISPWLPNGNITKHVQKHEEADRLQLLAQAATGLEYLHSLSIVHGDINPGNLLITEEGNACIGDFGIAAIITDPAIVELDSMTTSKPGAVRYMAPELLAPFQFNLADRGPSKESDVYSFAMTAYEVLSGDFPYDAGRESVTAFTIVSGGRPPRPINPTADRWLPNTVWDAIQHSWAQTPQSRLSIDLLHQAFTELEQEEKRDIPVTGNGKDTAAIHISGISFPVPSATGQKSPAQSARPSTKPPSEQPRASVQSTRVKHNWVGRVLARRTLFCCCR